MSKEFEAYIEYSRELEVFFEKLWSVRSPLRKTLRVLRHPPKLYLFGSIARGRYTYASNIDILIVLGKPIGSRR